jgi:hypothetical protein
MSTGPEDGNAHYGSEWDLGAFKAFNVDDSEIVLGVQYGDYYADTFSTDTKKLWVSLDFKLGPKPLRDLFDRTGRDQGDVKLRGSEKPSS